MRLKSKIPNSFLIIFYSEPLEQLAMSQNYQQSLIDIQNAVKESEKHIPQAEKAYIVIGDTGDGKSTLVNYIAENALVAKKIKLGQYGIEAPKQLGNVIIGANFQSVTTMPNKWIDSKGNIYWDCPGFNDTKGPVQDIKNGFYIKRIFEVSKQVKLIVVISQQTLLGRAKNLLALLKKLDNLFVNLSNMVGSFSLVLTRVKDIQNIEQVKEFFKDFLNQQNENLSTKQKTLLQYFASVKGCISFFKAPKTQGPIDRAGAIAIRNAIDKTIFVKKPQIMITVAPESKIILENIGKKINLSIEEFSKKFNEFLDKKCGQLIKNEISYSSVINQMTKILQYLKKMKTAGNLPEFLNNWHHTIQSLKLCFQLEQVQIYTNHLTFIREIKPDIQVSLQNWKSKFQIDDTIEKLIKQPQVNVYNNTSEIQIKAFLISARKISQIIQEKGANKVKHVKIFCYENLYIDQDIQAPGISFYILSRNWKVIGNRRIVLKGLSGKSFSAKASNNLGQDFQGNGSNGFDGLPGKSGETGGSFYGKLMRKGGCFGPGNLSIDIRGGNGGNGQDGGDGGNGLNGKDAQKGQVDKLNQHYLVSRKEYKWDNKDGLQKFNQIWKTIGTVNGQMLQTYRSVGQKGKKGGNGGRKGAGGLPGLSGCYKIQDFFAQIDKGSGSHGRQGKTGQPGVGGKNGKKYEGKYINQTAFTALRDVGKNIEQKNVSEVEINEKNQLGVRMLAPVLAGESVALGGLIGTEIAKQGAIEVAEQLGIHAARQAAIKTAQQSALNSVMAGVSSLGIGFAVQGTLSIVSSYLSSDWLVNPQYYDDGTAQSGNRPKQQNQKGQQKPSAPVQIDPSVIQSLANKFQTYSKQFTKSLNYIPSFI